MLHASAPGMRAVNTRVATTARLSSRFPTSHVRSQQTQRTRGAGGDDDTSTTRNTHANEFDIRDMRDMRCEDALTVDNMKVR